MEPLPNVRTAFSIISREESFQKNGSLSNNHVKIQLSAFNSSFNDSKTNKSRSQNQNLQCKHCAIKGHTIERCYKLIGYPKDYKQKSNFNSQSIFRKSFSNSNTYSSIAESSSFATSLVGNSYQHFLTTDQYSKVLRLINDIKLSEEVPANAYVAGISCNSTLSRCFISKFTWHSRLGHPANQALNVLKSRLNLDNEPLPPCEICHRAKQSREQFQISQNVTTKIGELVHLDVCGPYRLATIDGYKYFLTIIDDFSNATWVYLLKSKDEVFNCFLTFANILLNQFDVQVKTVRSDNGTEFVNNKMKSFFESKGILHQTSCVHTPQQKGVVERKNRHILNVSRSLLFQSGLPLKYWGEAVLTSVFLINRTPMSVLNGLSPFELVYKQIPKLEFLRVFGCLCFATRVNISDNCSERAEKVVLIGYSLETKGYKLLSLDTGRFFFSRDVRFYETVFPFNMKSDRDKVLPSRDPFSYDEPNLHDCVINRGGSRDIDATRNTDGVRTYLPLESSQLVCSPNLDGNAHTPWSVLIDGISDHHTSEGCESAPDCNQDDSVCTPQSSVGVTLSQRMAEENNEMFTELTHDHISGSFRPRRESKLPAKFNSCAMDNKGKYNNNKSVNCSFLDEVNKCFVSNLNKTNEPQNFLDASFDFNWVKAMNEEMKSLYHNDTWVVTGLPSNRKQIECKWIYNIKCKSKGDIRVCKLLKSLYGLKQVPRKWNEKLSSYLFDFGFTQSMSDYLLFTRHSKNLFVVLLMYANDIILTGNEKTKIEKVKGLLKSRFLIKDLGKQEFFLGIEVIDIKRGICLTQRNYCLESIHGFGMLGCKLVKIPLEMNFVFNRTENEKRLQNIIMFQKSIGKIIYLTFTRSDTAYVVQTANLFMHSLCISHLEVAFTLLRFLKQNPGKGIKISVSWAVKGFIDADWAKCLKSRRSVTGFVVFLGDSFVLWRSKKQDIVSLSSTESEYRALGLIACEVTWFLEVLLDLLTLVSILCDNEFVVKLALNLVFYEKTKRFEVDGYLICEKFSKGFFGNWKNSF